MAAPFSRDPHGSTGRRPRLLVSVRNADEAIAALAGGADIIDVKEPRRGPLGMADANIVADIVACAGDRAPVSAALGEVRDWVTPSGDLGAAGAGNAHPVTGATGSASAVPPTSATGFASAIPVLPSHLALAKLGLAGCARHADWVTDWLAVRTAFEHAAGRPLSWVAVAYGDAQIADAPPVNDVIFAAARTGCRGVLIDTYNKSGGSILELFAARDLRAFAALARAGDLFLAIAGRLHPTDLRRRSLRVADIIGVRSAACTHGDRLQPIAAAQVARLQRELRVHARRRTRHQKRLQRREGEAPAEPV
ncbi:MAG: (5-formylfuran-3-yl)methyl phosphate synthase [Planctomycetaceae bacterium]